MSKPQFTPGPWSWYGSTYHTPRVYLATVHSGRTWVMGFRRSGMQGAEPVFRVGGRMVPASEFVRFDVDRSVMGKAAASQAPSVYRQDFSEIDHPDAHLIASAPALYEALEELVEAAERVVGEHNAPHDCWSMGPSTGDPIKDYVICPGCVLLNEAIAARAALAQARGEQP